jgi:hypothetical protein
LKEARLVPTEQVAINKTINRNMLNDDEDDLHNFSV